MTFVGGGGEDEMDMWKVTVDRTMIGRLMATIHDWKWVRVCTGILSQRLCGYGVGVFRDADGSEVVLEDLPTWMDWIDINAGPFIVDALTHLACLGFVVYDVDVESGKMWVVDPREVEIVMYLKVGMPTQYGVRHRMFGWGRGPERVYRICVLDEPEHETGLPSGLLVSLLEEYDASKILMRNLQQRDTQNALTMFGIQTVPKTTQQVVAGMGNPRAFAHTHGMAVAGHAAGMMDVLDAHADAREHIFMHNLQFVRNMEAKAPTHLGGIVGRIAVADYDAGKIAAYTPPSDTTIVQKAFAPEFRGFTTTLLHFERSLFCAFGVPFSVVERHTGNHTNAIDLERELLSQSVSRYVGHINMMLGDIGRVMFGGIGECRLRLRTGLSEQRVLRLYTSGLYTQKAVMEYYVKNFKDVPEHFEKEDHRFDDGVKLDDVEKGPRAGHQKTRDATSSSPR